MTRIAFIVYRPPPPKPPPPKPPPSKATTAAEAAASKTTAAETTAAATGIVSAAASPARVERRNAATSRARRFLHPLKVDKGATVIEERSQLGILSSGQIALCLHDEEVGGEAHLKAALFRLEPRFSQLPRDHGRVVSREAALDL
jgi:hypothetical protein